MGEQVKFMNVTDNINVNTLISAITSFDIIKFTSYADDLHLAPIKNPTT